MTRQAVIAPDGTEYPTMTAAGKATRQSRHTIARLVANPRSRWRYRDDPHITGVEREAWRCRAVVGPDGEYASIKAAARETGIPVNTIRERARDQRCGWRYADEPQRVAEIGGEPTGWAALRPDTYSRVPAGW